MKLIIETNDLTLNENTKPTNIYLTDLPDSIKVSSIQWTKTSEVHPFSYVDPSTGNLISKFAKGQTSNATVITLLINECDIIYTRPNLF